MTFISRRVAGVLLASAVSLSAAGAYAQQGEDVLEEILVTAQKRQESLQDVPVSVAVVTGDRLQEIGIRTYRISVRASQVQVRS
jgi:iron complex outermembrane receptor protein